MKKFYFKELKPTKAYLNFIQSLHGNLIYFQNLVYKKLIIYFKQNKLFFSE
tara:strand:- start:567 stop:719 length:153 start_codon:yes stop_codon:yes gene_type:complete